MDAIAPGHNDLTVTTKAVNTSGSCASTINDPKYSCFNGTSAAAPHVTGLAALMMSYHNFPSSNPANLAVEDMEALIQRYALDKGPSGYDPERGWGLIDAGATMGGLVKPVYEIEHHSVTNISMSSQVSQSAQVILPTSFGSLAAGTYFGERWKLTHIGAHIYLGSQQVEDVWLRQNACIGTNGLGDDHFAQMTHTLTNNKQSLGVFADVYVYKITHNILGQSVNPTWYPADLANAKVSYTVYLKDPSKVGITDQNNYDFLSVYPNPATDIVQVKIATNKNERAIITLTDVYGKALIQKEKEIVNGDIISLDIAGFSSGLYFVDVQIGDRKNIRKLIKE